MKMMNSSEQAELYSNKQGTVKGSELPDIGDNQA